MPLSSGDRLGSCEIVAAIGKGGMGEAWRAREARAIAALNHANVCTLCHIGPDYLVMEYIEGPTLAESIQEGPIPLEEALGIAKQIADAPEAAHEKNIVYRDLKPANVKIRPDGFVKVLDFGLAKAGDPREVTADSPTMMPGTQMGMILGTAGYMSPEQARGKQVDKRADIWAFGVVLYEMVTGKRLFEDETVSDSLAACLEKDPRRRLRDIGDWELLLEERSGTGGPSQTGGSAPLVPVKAGWVGAAGVLAVWLATLAFVHFRERLPLERVVRLSMPLPENSNAIFPELSPDGRRLVLVIDRNGQGEVYIRPFPMGSEVWKVSESCISPQLRHVRICRG